MNSVTIIMAYYENPGMLVRQYDMMKSYSVNLKSFLRLIVIDDGSPKRPAFPALDLGISFKLYRMKVDIRWNQDACRNIGAHHCETKWMLMTDMDHLIPEITARKVVTGDFSKRSVYRFSRLSEPKLDPYKPHPNSWFLTKDLFDKAGGYDERFAGWYGTDFDLSGRLKAQAKEVIQLDEPLIRVPREVTPDASTIRYKRKTEEDSLNIRRIRKEIRDSGNVKPRCLLFPYEQVL